MSKPGQGDAAVRVAVKPGKAYAFLMGAVVVVLGLHLTAGLLHLAVDTDWSGTIWTLFGVDGEANVPSFFSGLLWVVAAATCWLLSRISHTRRSASRSWLAMAVICGFLALDEAATLHERLSEPVRELTGADGYLLFAWVIPYSVLCLVIAVALGRFVWALGRPVNLLVLAAGLLFVSGAAGLESLQSGLVSAAEEESGSLTYIALYTAEETLEMLGVTLFIFALLRQLERSLAEPDDAPALVPRQAVRRRPRGVPEAARHRP